MKLLLRAESKQLPKTKQSLTKVLMTSAMAVIIATAGITVPNVAEAKGTNITTTIIITTTNTSIISTSININTMSWW